MAEAVQCHILNKHSQFPLSHFFPGLSISFQVWVAVATIEEALQVKSPWRPANRDQGSQGTLSGPLHCFAQPFPFLVVRQQMQPLSKGVMAGEVPVTPPVLRC